MTSSRFQRAPELKVGPAPVGPTFRSGALLVLLSLQPVVTQTTSFSVTSDPPGANVYVDGALVGVTPLAMARPAPGPHRIFIARPGYLDNARTLEFAAQQPTALHVALTPDSSGATGGNWFVRRKWIWIGAAGGGAGAAALVSRREGPPPNAGTVFASPSTGLQGGTAISFASQGASVESGKPLEYAWNFGDGLTGSGPLVMHVYNTAGMFTATVTVSAGKKSTTASGSPVSVRDLTGTWRGTVAGADTMFVLAQNGTSVIGTYREPGATGTVMGTVRSTSPRINLTITTPAYSASYAADPNENIDALTGTYREQSLTLGLVLTRQ